MRTKFSGILTLFMAFVVQLTFAQEKTITGTVTDAESGMPLAGVNIIVKGTSTGTQSDFDGNYQLRASQGQTLVFTYIGYAEKSVTVGQQSTIDLTMSTSTAALGEVVVVAYGESSEAKVASSISTVQAKQIEDIPLASVDQALQGRVAGANVKVSSGQPGKSGSVLIRGRSSILGGTANNQPLYIIDGVPVNEDRFRSLNNSDIESMSVLKDAGATAIYGNRAANGVIIITTKSGNYSTPFTVRYNTFYGTALQPDPNFQPMNAQQYLTFSRDILKAGDGVNMSDAEIAATARQTNTNWGDILFQKGTTTSHQVSVTQGTETTKYYSSLGYMKQEGITLGSKLERFNFRTNLDTKPNEKFDLSSSISLNYSINNFVVDPNRESFIFDDNTGGELDNPFIVPYIGLPHYSPYNPDGSLNYRGTVRSGAIDPSTGALLPNGANGFKNTPYLAMNTAKYGTDEEREFVGIGSLQGNYHFNDNFTLGAQFGINYSNIETLNITPPTSIRGLVTPNINSEIKGEQVESFVRFLTTDFNPYLKYHGEIDKHTFDAGIYMEYIYKNLQTSGFQAFGLDPHLPGSGNGFTPGNVTEGPDDDTYYYIPNVFSTEIEEALFSYFANLNYDYDTRYGLTLSIRRDGSSRFLEENRWGTFYAIGGRWNLDNEDFLSDSDFLSTLKLRASYGKVGNKNVAFPTDYYVGYPTIASVTGYQGNPAYVSAGLVDRTLEWETTTQANVGVDFGFWENRLSGSVDVYSETTDGLFFPQDVTLSSGFSSVTSNVAEVSNKGVEVELSYDIVDNKDFLINVFANVAYNKNEIVSLNGPDFSANGDLGVGQPIRSFYSVRWAGVNPANGEPLWLDIDGNLTNTYNPDDAVFIGKSADPTYYGGFGTLIEYKGFALNALFSYAADQYRQNGSLALLRDPSQGTSLNQEVGLLDAWQEVGDVTGIPAVGSGYSRIGNQGSRFIEDASFIKLRSVTLGYTFDRDVLKRSNLFTSLRIYVQGTNLFTWSKWRGFDPESTFANSFFEYPSPRQFTAGLDVSF